MESSWYVGSTYVIVQPYQSPPASLEMDTELSLVKPIRKAICSIMYVWAKPLKA